MNILVSGGAGYIGSHTCVELLNAGYSVVVIDNFVNSHPVALERVKKITNRKIILAEGDIRDEHFLIKTIIQYNCQAVIHFAGYKSVRESVENPLSYYNNNVHGTLSLVSAMNSLGIKKLIFSSSASVYGEPLNLPIAESHPFYPTNPYAQTKRVIENILKDLYKADPSWGITILRYFNPLGAHPSGLIGEDPQGIPNNLMPFITQVAVGKLKYLNIWGNDYPTHDGTGVRDYIHVVDLAVGHVKALENLLHSQYIAINLGTGVGYSVFDIIKSFEKVSGKTINYQINSRRPGDVAICYADPSLAERVLQWRAIRHLDTMCADHWNWQVNNPEGYRVVHHTKSSFVSI